MFQNLPGKKQFLLWNPGDIHKCIPMLGTKNPSCVLARFVVIIRNHITGKFVVLGSQNATQLGDYAA